MGKCGTSSCDHAAMSPNADHPDPPAATERPDLPPWLADAERLDLAVYAAIAATGTPALDRALAGLSRAADYSKLSLAAAGALSLFGGPTGRRAALSGEREQREAEQRRAPAPGCRLRGQVARHVELEELLPCAQLTAA